MRIYAVFVLFCSFAYSFWYNLLGPIGAAVLIVVLDVATITIWIWRRRSSSVVPAKLSWAWPSLVYVTLAALSLVWSTWPWVTTITWVLLASATVQGLFLASQLRVAELVVAADRALKCVLLSSLAIEIWIALRGTPLVPNFADVPADPDPHWYWVRGNLFDGLLSATSRIQGIVGNSNLLAAVSALSILVSLAVLVARRRHRVLQSIYVLLAGWMLLRGGSATILIALILVAAAVVVASLFARMRRRSARLWAASGVLAALAVVGLVIVMHFDAIQGALGKDGTLTGRTRIWSMVLERAAEAPILGHGFASPWLPWDPSFSRWIFDHEIVVFQAHNMWIDAYLQLGSVGVVVLATVVTVAASRAWRLATSGRNLGGKRASRTLVRALPLAVVVLLLTQGITESSPMMLWGWLVFTVLLATLPPLLDLPARLRATQEDRDHGTRGV